jgi:predicted nucleic acid-binding Zn ribbon protein
MAQDLDPSPSQTASKQLRDLRETVEKECPECSKLFNRLKTARYCSDRCKNRVNMRNYRKKLRRSRLFPNLI